MSGGRPAAGAARSLPVVHRRCSRCTACCTVMAVTQLSKPAHQKCPHSCDAGCSIYATRPSHCRQFECRWLLGDDLEEDRPDKIGIFFSYGALPALGKPLLVCKQLWPDAVEQPRPRALIAAKAAREAVLVCSEKSYRLIGPPPELARIQGEILKAHGKPLDPSLVGAMATGKS